MGNIVLPMSAIFVYLNHELVVKFITSKDLTINSKSLRQTLQSSIERRIIIKDFLPIFSSCASSLVELTLVEGEVVFLECDDAGGGGGGGGIKSAVAIIPFDVVSVVSITHVCWGEDPGAFKLVEVWLRFEDDVGMIDSEAGNIEDKVNVAVPVSSFNVGWTGCGIHIAGVSVVDLGSWLHTVWDNSIMFWCSVLIPLMAGELYVDMGCRFFGGSRLWLCWAWTPPFNGSGLCFNKEVIEGGLSWIWNWPGGLRMLGDAFDEIIGTQDTSLGKLCIISDFWFSICCCRWFLIGSKPPIRVWWFEIDRAGDWEGGKGILNLTADDGWDEEDGWDAGKDVWVFTGTAFAEWGGWSKNTSWISEDFLLSVDSTWRPCKPPCWVRTRTLLSFHDIL